MTGEASSQDRIELAPGVRVDSGVVTFTFSPSTGPGGQNVNRRSTAATLRVPIEALPITRGAKTRLGRALGSKLLGSGEISITSSEHRTQRRNRAACLERLRELLVKAMVPPKPRKKTRPSRGAVERRIKEKKQRGEVKRRRQSRPGEE